jgi:hypothetical protein
MSPATDSSLFSCLHFLADAVLAELARFLQVPLKSP